MELHSRWFLPLAAALGTLVLACSRSLPVSGGGPNGANYCGPNVANNYGERFFLGGSVTLRGFEFRGVGPNTENLPDDGETMLRRSAVYRFLLYSTPAFTSYGERFFLGGSVTLRGFKFRSD